jgi:type VI secretion system protein ImpB
LPFVMGIMGEFSGDPTKPLPSLTDRKFVQIDRDNFNDVMARIGPGLNLKVDNTLAGDGSQIAVDLKFNSIEDFDPGRIVEQVPALKALMETRNKLRDLMSKVDRSEELEGLLEQVLQSESELKTLSGQLGLDKKEG